MTLRCVIFALAVLAPLGDASASGWSKPDLPKHDISLGPSVAYAYGGGHGYSLNLDVAYTYKLLTVSANLKFIDHEPRMLVGPQLEVTGWFFANIGGGVGYLFGDAEGPVFHLFIGVPMGDDWINRGPFKSLFFEPYYRLNFFLPGALQLIHEVGVFIKLTTYSI